jgi:hypothetical protein
MKFGIATLIIESSMKRLSLDSFFEFGWGNGYILLPQNHPFYGKDYDSVPISVHGGVTFGQVFDSDSFKEWIEKREFFGDINFDNYQKFNNYWILGFDTGHCGDNPIYCSKDYVENETNSMLEQCLNDDIEGMKKYKTIYLRKNKLKTIERRR